MRDLHFLLVFQEKAMSFKHLLSDAPMSLRQTLEGRQMIRTVVAAGGSVVFVHPCCNDIKVSNGIQHTKRQR
jgi:hypothetical protein